MCVHIWGVLRLQLRGIDGWYDIVSLGTALDSVDSHWWSDSGLPPSSKTIPNRDRFKPEHFAFNTIPVLKSTLPKLECHFLDLQLEWKSSYDFISRSGARKQNKMIWGDYSGRCLDTHRAINHATSSLGGRADTPTVELGPFGVRVAGKVMPVTWDSPWSFHWDCTDNQVVHDRWWSGQFTFHMDAIHAFGTVTHAPTSGVRQVERWRLYRSRFVGGYNNIGLYSTRRLRMPDKLITQWVPFAPTNPDQFFPRVPTVQPETEPVRDSASGWEELIMPKVLDKIRKAIKHDIKLMKACLLCVLSYTDNQTVVSDGDWAHIMRTIGKTPTVIASQGDLKPKAKLKKWRKVSDSLILEVLPGDPPLTRSAREAMVHNVFQAMDTTHPSFDMALPADILSGFQHSTCLDQHAGVMITPCPDNYYRRYWAFDRGLRKEVKENLNIMTDFFMDLPSFPFIRTVRDMVPKPNGYDSRPIANHSYPSPKQASALSDRAQGRHVPISVNDRLDVYVSELPPLQLVKGADIGQNLAIFLSHDIVVSQRNHDMRACFHTFGVSAERSLESGMITIDGATLSVVVDYGYKTGPHNACRGSSYVPRVVDNLVHERIMNELVLLPNEESFMATRRSLYGEDSAQALLIRSECYVDDLHSSSLNRAMDILSEVVTLVGKDWGIVWTVDKSGVDVTIGYHFIARSWIQSRILLRNPKPSQYARDWDTYASRSVVEVSLSQSVLGQINHVATVDLRLKACSADTNRAMYVKSRLGNKHMHPLPVNAADQIRKAANLIRQDMGINLFCDTRVPEHFMVSSITQRSDACLNEPDNYNGFGIWWVIPQAEGGPIILAAYDEWTKDEEEKLGLNIAAAEAVPIVLGTRILKAEVNIMDFHDNFIQLSDSETCSVKFNNVRLGSHVLENLRSTWQSDTNDLDISTHLGYIPREWNVGADLLSKGHWDLFCTVMQLAGLNKPRRVQWTDQLRSTRDLL